MRNETDIFERDLKRFVKGKVLDILLYDQTTQKNIIWATNSYAEKGKGYQATDEIKAELILDNSVIVPRVLKDKAAQSGRTKKMAEVFTPAWLCKEMNDAMEKALDEDPRFTDWKGKSSQLVLEISCGEGPFLVSRYDTTTGEPLPLEKRIGILDRKLRLISEHVKTAKSWLKYAYRAYQSTYGYEWQGDSLLLAREAMFYSFVEYYQARFNEMPPDDAMIKVVDIISWNLWQMDGLKGVVPLSCHPEEEKKEVLIQGDLFDVKPPKKEKATQLSFCPGCLENDCEKHNGIYCKIKDWVIGRRHIRFIDLAKEE